MAELEKRDPMVSTSPADPFGDRERRELADLRRAECPYCRKALRKVPGAKTKCPHCGSFMFVRTRPWVRTRVVVTEADANEIERQYQILHAAPEPDFRYIATEEEVKAVREELTQTLQGEGYDSPSDDDVRWAFLGKKATADAKVGDLGLSRNWYLTKANFLVRRGKLRPALCLYLFVCILDLNGANNVAGYKNNRELLKKFPAFDPDPRRAFAAPVVLEQISRITTELGLGNVELHALFEKLYNAKLPLTVQVCWSRLVRAMKLPAGLLPEAGLPVTP